MRDTALASTSFKGESARSSTHYGPGRLTPSPDGGSGESRIPSMDHSNELLAGTVGSPESPRVRVKEDETRQFWRVDLRLGSSIRSAARLSDRYAPLTMNRGREQRRARRASETLPTPNGTVRRSTTGTSASTSAPPRCTPPPRFTFAWHTSPTSAAAYARRRLWAVSRPVIFHLDGRPRPGPLAMMTTT